MLDINILIWQLKSLLLFTLEKRSRELVFEHSAKVFAAACSAE